MGALAGHGCGPGRRGGRHPDLGQLRRGEPQQDIRPILFHGHPAPHPTAALVLVAVACLVLAWRRRYPVAVLAVAAAAVTAYSLLGYVNGAAVLAPDHRPVRGGHPAQRTPGRRRAW